MSESYRKYCYQCLKPEVVCICKRVKQVKNRTIITILQHPLERSHALGTARIAKLGLSNCDLEIAYPDDEGLLSIKPGNTDNCALLYPSDKAVDLESEQNVEKIKNLIVIDGTWANAKGLYRDNKWLWELPHYRLNPKSPSRYRIRTEPDVLYISTIEAIVASLKILEPENSTFDKLLQSFDSMIDDQIEYQNKTGGSPRKKKSKNRKIKTIPTYITDEFEKIVVIYGENIRSANGDKVLLSFVAKRLSTGETFERFIKPADELYDNCDLVYSGIEDVFEKSAVTKHEFIDSLNDFLNPDDILSAWNSGHIKTLSKFSKKINNRFLVIKAAYGNIVKEKFGTLDEVVKSLNIKPQETEFQGRASQRISNAIAILNVIKSHKP